MKVTISSAAVALALGALSSTAQADTFHNTNTEIGYEVHISDTVAGKTPEQVRQELNAAKSNKRERFFTNLNAAKPGWMVPTEKTREQVAKNAIRSPPKSVRASTKSTTPVLKCRLLLAGGSAHSWGNSTRLGAPPSVGETKFEGHV